MQTPALNHDAQSPRPAAENIGIPSTSTEVRPAALHVRYAVPRERGLTWFLIISVVLFTLAACLAALIPPKEKLPPMIEVDLGFDGVENEPPPLGEPDAGAGEEKPPEPEPAAPTEEEQQPAVPEPQPTPEPEPVMEEAPSPVPVPQFEVPKDEPLPKPEPKPKPAAKPQPKPVTKPVTTQPRPNAQPSLNAPSSGSGPAGSGLTTGRAGVRGSPGGQVGGRGGGRGDFVSTPHPQYDATARQRGYQGRGTFVIEYSNGRIISVTANQSTGVPYLDARTITWIKSRWRVKSGTSGSASLPITWQLR